MSAPMPEGALAATGGSIRLLVCTTLYPNAAQPRHGIFVEERLRKLVASRRVKASVIAPVPWFPLRNPRFGRYAQYAAVPRHESRFGIPIEHPRYLVVPKVGMNIAPALLYRVLLPAVRRHLAERGDFDVIDAHYFYPDGVAAVRVGKTLGKPVVVTARGNDLTLLPNYRRPRDRIRWAAEGANALATVSEALKDRATAIGIDATKVTVLRNGVDLDLFRPVPRQPLRDRLGLNGPTWLTVGHLIERKGVHIAISALAGVPAATLLVVGDGPEGAGLQRLAQCLGVAARVRFLGAAAHTDLPSYYNAADVLIHPASREGMPNVVLEALACGTPVVAAPFAGAAEVISEPAAGVVAAARTPDAIAAAWRLLQVHLPERAATRGVAEARLGWGPVVDAQCAWYARVLAASARRPSVERPS